MPRAVTSGKADLDAEVARIKEEADPQWLLGFRV